VPVWRRRRRRRFCHQHSPTAFRMLKRSQTAQHQRRGLLIQRHSEEGGASKGKQAWLRAGGGQGSQRAAGVRGAARHATPPCRCVRTFTHSWAQHEPACAFDGAHPRGAPLLPLYERGVCVRACTARLRPKLSTRALRLQTSRCPAHASLAAWLPWPGAKKRLACAAAQLLGTRRRRRGRA
jgi:hypothetical protein